MDGASNLLIVKKKRLETFCSNNQLIASDYNRFKVDRHENAMKTINHCQNYNMKYKIIKHLQSRNNTNKVKKT